VVDKELDSLDTAGTWNVVDKVKEGKEDSCKCEINVKRIAAGSIAKITAQLVAQGITQYPVFDVVETYDTIVCYDSLRLLLTYSDSIGLGSTRSGCTQCLPLWGSRDQIYMTLHEGCLEICKTAPLQKFLYCL
jgi:hypothetical protein